MMRIVPGPSGNFLCPPGHPHHSHHVEDGPRRVPNLIASLDYALDNEYGDVPEDVQAKAHTLFAVAKLVRSELWERMVYGYFRNSYAPEDGDRNVSRSVAAGPPERHLGYLLVRRYFPDAEPRGDLIHGGGLYGQLPCTKCGKALQYEADVDTFAEAITSVRDCPTGGQHTVNIPPVGVDQ